MSRIYIPPRRGNFADDISLLKLDEPIPLGGQFIAVRLQSRPAPIGAQVTVAGWGAMGRHVTMVLMTASFPLHPYETCRRVFPSLFDKGMLCAGVRGIDACPGDSGGPLVVKGPTPSEDYLVGIVSWGPPCGT